MEDEIIATKSANQLWKESGTSLPFADWLEREKNKGKFIPNKFVQDSLAKAKIQLGIEKDPNAVLVNDPSKNKWLGLSKGALALSIIIILGAVTYKVYINQKK